MEKIYTMLFILLFSMGARAQKTGALEPLVHHDPHRNEIGIGNAPVYSIQEKELAYGLHVHYLYNLPNTNFGIGLGYEKIYDEHKHHSVAFIVGYRPVENLHFSLSPGIASENKQFDQPQLAIHFETAYEFEFHDFHFGPVFEVAADKEDFHVGLGLHLGIGF